MTRRPRSRRPPRLDLPPAPRRSAAPKARVHNPARAIVRARLAGVASPIGRAELSSLVAGVVSGNAEATLGLDLAAAGALGRPTRDEVWAALAAVWGIGAGGATLTIDPERTLAAANVAAELCAEVCATGGSVAFATSRPASLLGCYQELARHLGIAGARILRSNAPRPDAPRPDASGPSANRAVWWVGDVAVATDGRSLRADDCAGLPAEWLFGVGRPALVVADRGFAAAAIAAGLPTLAFADLDAVALGVMAGRGAPVTAVPLDCGRPPEAYKAMVALLTGAPGLAAPTPAAPGLAARSPGEARLPHSTTPAPGAYAAPESGGEG